MADTTPQPEKPDALTSHTKRIKLLRKILPVLALVLLLALAIGANPDWRQALTDTAPNADRLVIDAPVFEGRLADGRPYILLAQQGRQKTDGTVVLSQFDMVINQDAAQGRLQLNAAKADYRPRENAATLSGQVRGQDSDNNRFQAAHMAADLSQGVLRASGVTMNGPAGRIAAQTMTAQTKTRHYRFVKAAMRLKSGQE